MPVRRWSPSLQRGNCGYEGRGPPAATNKGHIRCPLFIILSLPGPLGQRTHTSEWRTACAGSAGAVPDPASGLSCKYSNNPACRLTFQKRPARVRSSRSAQRCQPMLLPGPEQGLQMCPQRRRQTGQRQPAAVERAAQQAIEAAIGIAPHHHAGARSSAASASCQSARSRPYMRPCPCTLPPAPAPKGGSRRRVWPSGCSGSARPRCAASGCRRAAASPLLQRLGAIGIHGGPLLAIGGPAELAPRLGTGQIGASHGDQLIEIHPCTLLAITSAMS